MKAVSIITITLSAITFGGCAEVTCGEGLSIVNGTCVYAEDDIPQQDLDGDGVPAMQDCNDSNPSIYPGAPEVCGDGVDQDCDGQDRLTGKCAPSDECANWDVDGGFRSCPDESDGDDVDGDGYLYFDDCNDHDWRINPGAAEICGDGIDQNCDGVDEYAYGQDGGPSTCGDRNPWIDRDGDGYSPNDPHEPDCNDGDRWIHPDAQEYCNDGVDSDCEGTDNGQLYTDYDGRRYVGGCGGNYIDAGLPPMELVDSGVGK